MQKARRLDKKGPTFQVERGVKQGDPLSPKLIVAVLESIFRKLNWNDMGLNINGLYLSHLRFADDVVLLPEYSDQLEYMLKSFNYYSETVGLLVNRDKTKVTTNRDKKLILLQSTPIEYVDDYVYIGHLITFKFCT